jgi:hypothetical protein
MLLSVVILGSFTTETHAMAHHITTDTPDDYLHHLTGRNPQCRRQSASRRQVVAQSAGTGGR